MSFTYSDKQNILHYLSDPNRWSDCSNLGFFMDDRRKWSCHTQRNIHIARDSKYTGTKTYLVHQDTGSSLLIERVEGGLSITDESDRVLLFQGNDFKTDDDMEAKYTPKYSTDEVGIDNSHASVVELSELDLFVRFSNTGAKSLFLEKEGVRIDLAKPSKKLSNSLEQGRFFHVISFNLSATDGFGLPTDDLLTGIKLVVAKDFDIEPDLETFNEIDTEGDGLEVFLSRLGENQYRPEDAHLPWQWQRKIDTVDLSPLEIAWIDSTEFNGHYAALPTQFSFEKTEDGFDLMTDLDSRERILSHSGVFKAAMAGSSHPTQMINSQTAPHSMLHFLSNGETTRDHRGREWSYIVFKSEHSAAIADQTREVVRRNFGLSGHHFSVLNFDNGLCLLAMRSEALEATLSSYRATIEMLAMIKDGGNDVKRMNELLSNGADLRFIDPEAVFKGRTFANEMHDAGNTVLLTTLQKKFGIRDLSTKDMDLRC